MQLYHKIIILSILIAVLVLLVLIWSMSGFVFAQQGGCTVTIDDIVNRLKKGVNETNVGIRDLNQKIQEQRQKINQARGIGAGKERAIRSNIIQHQQNIISTLKQLQSDLVGQGDKPGAIENLGVIQTRTTTGEFTAADKQYIDQVVRYSVSQSQKIQNALRQFEGYLKNTKPLINSIWDAYMTDGERTYYNNELQAAAQRIKDFQRFQQCKITPPPATEPKPQPPPEKCELKITNIKRMSDDEFAITVNGKPVNISAESIINSGPPKNIFEPVREAYEKQYNGGKPLLNCTVTITADAKKQCLAFKPQPKPPTNQDDDPCAIDNLPAVAQVPLPQEPPDSVGPTVEDLAKLDAMIGLLEEQFKENTSVIQVFNQSLGLNVNINQILIYSGNLGMEWVGFGRSGEALNVSNFTLNPGKSYNLILNFNKTMSGALVGLTFIMSDGSVQTNHFGFSATPPPTNSQATNLILDSANIKLDQLDSSKIVGLTAKNIGAQAVIIDKIIVNWSFTDQALRSTLDANTRARLSCLKEIKDSNESFQKDLVKMIDALKKMRADNETYSRATIEEIAKRFREWLLHSSKCKWGGCALEKFFPKEWIENNSVEAQRRLKERQQSLEALYPAIGVKDVKNYKCPICK
ncbi:MAG: hypothetical protein ABH822_01175 [Patescibacteria group bacterium]